jgi:hypothetical protein
VSERPLARGEATRPGPGLARWAIATAAVLLCAACAAANSQVQLDRARGQLRTYRQYRAPDDYRERLDDYLEGVLRGAGARSVMMTEPEGAIVCGHVSPRNPEGGRAGYLPFGAIFERDGSVRWLRVYQPFQGMYTTSMSESHPSDDDVAIAIACGIPLVF